MADGFTSFVCNRCKTEIEASFDLIGQETECPACGATLTIPDNREDGLKRYTADDIDSATNRAMKSRTIRIDLGDF